MPDLWSTLDSQERVNRIMKVMVKAGKEKQFHDDCLGVNGADSRGTIEKEADVKFDDKFVLHCHPDRETVENQIVLQFPDDEIPETSPIRKYWLCTYVDYIPAKPPTPKLDQ